MIKLNCHKERRKIMAVKTKTLGAFDSDIKKLQEQMEKIKKERKKHEENIILKIGKAYVSLVSLDNKDLTVEDILKDITSIVQDKKQSLKQQNSQKQNQNEQ